MAHSRGTSKTFTRRVETAADGSPQRPAGEPSYVVSLDPIHSSGHLGSFGICGPVGSTCQVNHQTIILLGALSCPDVLYINAERLLNRAP